MTEKTFLIELTSNTFNIETLIHLDEIEFAKLIKKAEEREELIEEVFLKEYVDGYANSVHDIIYIKDYSDSRKIRYALINKNTIKDLFITVVGYVDGKILNTKEFKYKL